MVESSRGLSLTPKGDDVTDGSQLERIRRLLEGARNLRDPESPLGRAARAQLPGSTGLSPRNVDWALENSLEVGASDVELQMLCANTPTSKRAHVLLSANVFVAALRAVAIGIACSPQVFVRASRREPIMARLLAEAAPGLFQLVETLEPSPGDHCWAYGSDATLAELESNWTNGVVLHANGSGYGVIVLGSRDLGSTATIESAAASTAIDVAAFDQRGCLSPRVVLIDGKSQEVEAFSNALAGAMRLREEEIPMGLLSTDERAELRRYHDTMCVAGRVLPAGSGMVTLESEPLPWVVPPVGRVVHVRGATDAIAELRQQAAAITTVGVSALNSEANARLADALPNARMARIGRMQCPPLDGPVDLRAVTKTLQ